MNKDDKEAFEKWWGESSILDHNEELFAKTTWQSACDYKNPQIAELEAKLAECQAREERLSVLAIKWCPLEHHNYDEIKEYMAQDRSALNAMLAQHAHDKLMAFAQVCESIGENIHGPGRNDSEAYDCADAARLMAEEQLKP